MTTITGRRVAGALATLLAVAVLTSCGDDTVPVAADTGAARDSGLQPGDEVSAADIADLVADAVAQGKEAGSARVSLDAGGEKDGLSGEGEIDFSGDDLVGALTVDAEMLGGEAEVRAVDGVLYVKVPMLGDKFVEIDPDDESNPLGSMLGGAHGGFGGSLGGDLDLDSMLDGLEGAASGATYEGEDEVDGESLSHYTVEIDPTKLVDDAEHLGELADGKTFDVDLWFDGEDYLRQVALNAPMVGAVELSISDWGTDVSVEAPPADEITDFSGMSFAG